MGKTDFGDVPSLENWMRKVDVSECDYVFRFLDFIEGEGTMTTTNGPETVALSLLSGANIDAKLQKTRTVTSDVNGSGYWVAVRVFVPKTTPNKELKRVAYETAESMDVGTLVNYVANALVEVYKDDHEMFELDRDVLRDEHD